MRRLLVIVSLVASLLPAYAPPVAATHDNPPDCAKERVTGYIPVAQGTDDATNLHFQVFLPKEEIAGEGPYPAVIDYSGYQPGMHIWDGLHRHFTCEGYAVVGLNIRGTGCSGGDFDYFEPRQAEDGREAIDWLAEQDWSNGRFAMVGKSYPGITQLFVAGQPLEEGGEVDTPEGLVAIVPGHVFGDLYRDVPYPGGIMNVTFAAGWSAGRIYEPFQAPIEDQINREEFDQDCSVNTTDHLANPHQNPFVKALYNHFDGELFKERSPWYWADNIDVPTFLIESWQDEQVGSRATELTERFAPDLTWRMLATNGDHGEYYGSDVLPHVDEFLRYYLAQEAPADSELTYEEALAEYEARDRVVINWETGAGGGRVPAWTTTYSDWPAPNTTPWRLHLGPDGGMTDETPMPGEVEYRYAPVEGTQQRGGYKLTGDQPDETEASWSETPAEGTFAMFETDALDSDKVMAGPASVDLLVSSTAPDTDFQVTLTEVRPDGSEMFVQQGWLRASHRAEDETLSNELRPYQTHMLEDALPLIPGAPTELRIEIFPFGHAFREDSKIRIYVEAPHTKPDLWGFALLPLPALNTIHTEGSSVVFPLLEGEAAETPLSECTIRNQPCRETF